jgi:phosphoglycolate phosphatase
MPLKALIFDLDGTLVDTAPDLMAATNHVLALIDRPAIPADRFRHLVGHGALNLIRRGVAETGAPVDDAMLKRLYDALLVYYGDNIATHSKVFPGLLPLLDESRARGIKMGVCTNKVENLSHKLLNEMGLAQYFDAVVGGDTLSVMKPKVEPYNEVMKRLGIEAHHSLMVGDSETDIRTAQNVGVPVIAVSFGYTDKHVSHFKPTYVIDHYNEAWPLISPLL